MAIPSVIVNNTGNMNTCCSQLTRICTYCGHWMGESSHCDHDAIPYFDKSTATISSDGSNSDIENSFSLSSTASNGHNNSNRPAIAVIRLVFNPNPNPNRKD